MAGNNDLQQGLQDSYSGVKNAANSAKNAARTAKKTVGTAKKAVKKGRAAAKGAKKLFAMIPLPIKLYIAAGLGIAVFFGGLLYYIRMTLNQRLLVLTSRITKIPKIAIKKWKIRPMNAVK